MAKFGLFKRANPEPTKVFEGEDMEQDGSHVKIFAYDTEDIDRRRQVAAIRLEEGCYVQEIEPTG